QRAKQLRWLTRVKHVCELAQAQNGIVGNEWDRDPWLLGVQNGVVDLRTGTLRAGQLSDLIRTIAPVDYQGVDTPAPRWESFLMEIQGGEETAGENVRFLQRLFGYGTTGRATEHKLPILWGPEGRNGKDTLLGALELTLGPYARSVSNDVVIKARKPQAGA